jgi:hypothetical protein
LQAEKKGHSHHTHPDGRHRVAIRVETGFFVSARMLAFTQNDEAYTAG